MRRTTLLCARSCIASARQAMQDAIPVKQKVRNAKANYAAYCLWLAAQELRKTWEPRGMAAQQSMGASPVDWLEGLSPHD